MDAPDASEPWQPDAGDIVDILSHELRSPITTIHLGTRVLHDTDAKIPAPVRREVAAAVEEEAERLYRLVEDLLAVARHDHGANPLPARPVLLQHWLADVVHAEVGVHRRLRVRIGVPSDLPPVLADEAALAHVIHNLLANALRHASDGMPVEVVGRRLGASVVQLDVLDRGPGFRASDAERLFEPFYRGKIEGAVPSGAGLGLTAARRLMRAMGGDLLAIPRPDGGARLSLRLAVAEPEDDLEEPLEATRAAG